MVMDQIYSWLQIPRGFISKRILKPADDCVQSCGARLHDEHSAHEELQPLGSSEDQSRRAQELVSNVMTAMSTQSGSTQPRILNRSGELAGHSLPRWHRIGETDDAKTTLDSLEKPIVLEHSLKDKQLWPRSDLSSWLLFAQPAGVTIDPLPSSSGLFPEAMETHSKTVLSSWMRSQEQVVHFPPVLKKSRENPVGHCVSSSLVTLALIGNNFTRRSAMLSSEQPNTAAVLGLPKALKVRERVIRLRKVICSPLMCF